MLALSNILTSAIAFFLLMSNIKLAIIVVGGIALGIQLFILK